MNKISVVVPVKDRFDLAQVALHSILNQEARIHELVVVDDGSSTPADETFETIKVQAEAFGIQVVFVRHEVNKGVSAARNTGFHKSTGDIVCFCDSDDFWIPQKAGFVQDSFRRPDVNVIFHSFSWCYGTLRAYKILPKNRLIELSRILLIMFSVLSPSCLSMRRAAFGTGFPEDMRYHEDLEYFLRLSQKERIFFFNFPFTILGRAAGSEGGMTVNARKMREGAIEALERTRGSGIIMCLARAKIVYHRSKLRAK